MIVTRRLRAPLKLEPAEVRAALAHISCEGWTPALLSTEQHFLRTAELPEDVPWVRAPSTGAAARVRARGSSPGDLFFRPEGVYYLISREAPLQDPYGLVYADAPDEEAVAYVELGGMGPDHEPLDLGLLELTGALEAALRDTLDGRRVRYMKFDWESPQPTNSRLAALRASELGDDAPDDIPADSEDASEGSEILGASFIEAGLDADLTQGAETLAEQTLREFLREISRAGFARQRDLQARWGQRDRSDEAAAWIAEARAKNLLSTEYLLECRNSGDQIIRFKDPSDLTAGGHDMLIHAPCGRSFAEESLSEGYSLSVLGQSLLQKSHWMTVWVTSRLVAAGIPLDSILWNVAESGEEVDILLEFLGEVWIFELKDRTFSAGDAYPFNYRRSRYRADSAFIVTTDHVAADARRVFDDLFEQSRASEGVPRPIYIEGLGSFDSILHERVARSESNFAVRQLAPLTRWSGYDLRRVVLERLGRQTTPGAKSKQNGSTRRRTATEVAGDSTRAPALGERQPLT